MSAKTRVGRIAEYISRVLVEDSVADLSADRLEPDDFGFSSPRVTVEGSFADGASVRFSVGDPLPSGIPRDYFLFEGSGKIHAVSVDVRETLDVELHRLHALPQVSFSPDLLDGALFGGRQAFRLIREKDLWRIEEPFRYPADEAAVDRLLTLIRGMRFAYWISDAQGEWLSVFGLDAPRREVLFSIAPSVILRYGSGNELLEQRQVAAQELRFLVGNDVDGIGFYCQYDGSVYMASYLSMGFMAKADPWEYFSKAPLDLPAEALQSLSVRTDSGTDSYAFSLAERVLRNNQIAMDEHGSAVFDLYVEKNGLAVDTDAFLRFYGPLRHVSADGRLSEADAFQGDPILTVVLAFSGTERTVTFRRLDALHASMSVDGNAVHYVSLDEILPFIPE